MERLWAKVDRSSATRRWIAPFAFAVVVSLGATAVTWALAKITDAKVTFLFGAGAVLIAGWHGGFGPALLASALSLTAGVMLAQPGAPTLDPVNLAVIVLFMIAASVTGHYMFRSRKAAERRTRQLEQREANLQVLLHDMPLAMVVAARSGAILATNRTACSIFAGTTALTTIGDLFTLPDGAGSPAPATIQILEAAARRDRLIAGTCGDGRTREFSVSISYSSIDPDGFMTIYLRDETSRCAAERRVVEMQAEMAQIGRASAIAAMGSAVAHELNQPLTAAANYLNIARGGTSADADADADPAAADDAIDRALTQVYRASTILKGLRGFAQATPPAPRWIAFEALVADAQALFEFAVKEHDVDLDLNVDPDAGTVWADPIQIQQVLVNLIQNGAEAASSCKRRQVKLTAVPVSRDGLTVEVADSGPGLSRPAKAQLFQPFNTTKPAGLGIGLVISKAIVEAHGGTLAYRPGPLGGAAFHFDLRRRRRQADGAAP